MYRFVNILRTYSLCLPKTAGLQIWNPQITARQTGIVIHCTITKPTASIGSSEEIQLVHKESGRQVLRSVTYQVCLFVQEPSRFQIFSLEISERNFVDLCNTPPVVSHQRDPKAAVTLPVQTQPSGFWSHLKKREQSGRVPGTKLSHRGLCEIWCTTCAFNVLQNQLPAL